MIENATTTSGAKESGEQAVKEFHDHCPRVSEGLFVCSYREDNASGGINREIAFPGRHVPDRPLTRDPIDDHEVPRDSSLTSFERQSRAKINNHWEMLDSAADYTAGGVKKIRLAAKVLGFTLPLLGSGTLGVLGAWMVLAAPALAWMFVGASVLSFAVGTRKHWLKNRDLYGGSDFGRAVQDEFEEDFADPFWRTSLRVIKARETIERQSDEAMQSLEMNIYEWIESPQF